MTDFKPTNPKTGFGVRKGPQTVIPRNVLAEIGLGMLDGGLKYGTHNYRKSGATASVYIDAAYRHLDDWWEGEDDDPDCACQLSHITKAITSLIVLRDAMMNGNMHDDRPPKAKPYRADVNLRAGTILDAYPNPKPRLTEKKHDTDT